MAILIWFVLGFAGVYMLTVASKSTSIQLGPLAIGMFCGPVTFLLGFLALCDTYKKLGDFVVWLITLEVISLKRAESNQED